METEVLEFLYRALRVVDQFYLSYLTFYQKTDGYQDTFIYRISPVRKNAGGEGHPPQFRETQRQICRCSTTTSGEEKPDVGLRTVSDAERHEVCEPLNLIDFD